jgi:hypothetical protein
LVVVALAAAILVAAPYTANTVIFDFGGVTIDFLHCISYAFGDGDEPLSWRCCSGIKQIAGAIETPHHEYLACDYIKRMLKGSKPDITASIPSKCGVSSFPFAISTAVPCPTVSLGLRSTAINVA